MCGILGGYTPQPLSPAAIDRALARLQHRGPDDSGDCRDGRLALAVRRLAIIDLATGRQPLTNETGSVTVVCNGEIYNYRELRRELAANGHRFRTESDVEVLAHLYEEEGAELCSRLRGMFAFALWDRERQELLLARDRFGKKPLYVARTPADGLVFASELKGLRPLCKEVGGGWTLRPQAVYDYLSLGVVPQPGTLFEGVEMVPPGSFLRFRQGKVVARSYWSLESAGGGEPVPGDGISYREAVARVRKLIAEAVALRLRSDVPLGVFLSAGLDSSVVALEAARQVGSGLRTFTVGVDDPTLDESGPAARTARALGVDNTLLRLTLRPLEELERVVDAYDQPFADPSAIATLAISRLAREHVKVVLNGDGGDEIFAGYRRYVAAHLTDRAGPLAGWTSAALARWPTASLGRRTRLGLLARFARGARAEGAEQYLIWTTDMLREIDKRSIWRAATVAPTEERLRELIRPELSPLRRQIDADRRINLLSDLLVKMDMATMSASLEARSPLLDHHLAEFVAGLPERFLLRRGRRKALLRDAYRRELPAEVLRGPKRGFEIPLQTWLEGALGEILHDRLRSPTARIHDFVDRDFVAGLLDRRLLQQRNWAYIVYALLVLELWLERNA